MWREAQPWCPVSADSGTRAGSGPRPKAAPRPAIQGFSPESAETRHQASVWPGPGEGGEGGGGLKNYQKILTFGQQLTNNKSYQNGILYSGKCSHTLW